MGQGHRCKEARRKKETHTSHGSARRIRTSLDEGTRRSVHPRCVTKISFLPVIRHIRTRIVRYPVRRNGKDRRRQSIVGRCPPDFRLRPAAADRRHSQNEFARSSIESTSPPPVPQPTMRAGIFLSCIRPLPFVACNCITMRAPIRPWNFGSAGGQPLA